MDEKKLAQLYKAFVAKGASLPPEGDFVSALQDESVAKNFKKQFPSHKINQYSIHF